MVVRRATNLTAPATSFIGRTRELDELLRLHAEGRRLVTVLGPGGSGKTRLAREYGRRWLDAQTDDAGAWFCDLTEVRDLQELSSVVAGVLGMPLAAVGSDAALAEVGSGIAARGRVLLILDNVEAVTPVAAQAVTRWLGDAPEALFLVTSRQRLRLSSEAVFELGPLGLPDEDSSPTGAEAVELFVERARLATPETFDRPADLDVVARIVQCLDGLPLPIELAAARVRVMSPSELLRRLSDRLDVLGGADRDRPPRQATVRATMEWSFALLTPWEEAAAAQASIFRGGFDLEAAEAVLDLGAFADAPSVPEVIEALRDHAILHARPASRAGDPVRFGMYEVIRAHAAERLQVLDPAGHTAERHSRYYLDVIGTRARELAGGGPAEALDRLALESGNLEAVCRRYLGSRQPTADAPDAALRAVLALDPVRSLRGPLAPHASLVEAALAQAGDEANVSLRAEALHAQGRAQCLLGRYEAARASFEQGLALMARVPNAWTEADLRLGLGMISFVEGREAEAAHAYEAARALAAKAGHRRGLVMAETALGSVLQRDGQTVKAEARFEAALGVAREIGDEYLEALCISGLGHVHVERGERQQGAECFRQALSLHRRCGARRLEGRLLCYLAALDHEHGSLQAARESYREGLRCLRESGVFGAYSFFGGLLGLLEHELGLLTAARRQLQQVLAEARRLGERPQVIWLLGCLGAVEADAERTELAAAHLEEARGMLEERDLPAVRRALELQEGHLALAEARRGRDPAATTAEATARDRVRGRLRAVRDPSSQGEESPARLANEVLFAARVLERALDRTAARLDGLVVAEDGSFFQKGGGERVELTKTAAPRRLLARLARARVIAPGAPVSVDELVAAGWPGEHIEPKAAANRLHVALSTLRKLGLEGWIHRVKGGWLLDPDAPVHREVVP